MVDIPDLELEDLIEENTMSVIVRCLNPFVHKVGSLVKALPPPPPHLGNGGSGSRKRGGK